MRVNYNATGKVPGKYLTSNYLRVRQRCLIAAWSWPMIRVSRSGDLRSGQVVFVGTIFIYASITKRPNMKMTFKILTVASLLAVYSCNDPRKGEDSNEKAEEANEDKFKDNKARQDAEFVEEVVATNYAEIKLAELANQRSRNGEVKQLAQMLQADHSAALNELKTLAQAKAISVPVEEDEQAKRKLENFTEASGNEFDEKWCKEMLDKHEDSIDQFEKRLQNTDDAELKTWISKTLLTLRTHYSRLKTFHDSLKNKNS
jgi:putative membrane protein